MNFPIGSKLILIFATVLLGVSATLPISLMYQVILVIAGVGLLTFAWHDIKGRWDKRAAIPGYYPLNPRKYLLGMIVVGCIIGAVLGIGGALYLNDPEKFREEGYLYLGFATPGIIAEWIVIYVLRKIWGVRIEKDNKRKK